MGGIVASDLDHLPGLPLHTELIDGAPVFMGRNKRRHLELGEETWYPAEFAVLVVEVVSPESEVRDRERKPQLHAPIDAL